MSEKIIPDSMNNALGNVTGKVTETVGDFFRCCLNICWKKCNQTL